MLVASASHQALAQRADAGPDKVNCFGKGVVIGGAGDPSWCYAWSPKTGLDNPNVLNPKANPTATTTYTLTVTGPDFSFVSTDDVTVQALTGFTITLLQTTVCDGEPAQLRLEPVPANISRSDFTACLAGVTLTSRPRNTSLGNPLGTTTLTFDPLNANAESKIQKAIWYSTQASHCNNDSQYEISGSLVVDGRTINSTNKPTFTASASVGGGGCFDGSAGPTQYFTGTPQISAQLLPNGSWQGTIAQGTFARAMVSSAVWSGPATSQFMNMIIAEELFHKGQIEGTTSNILIDLWRAERVINAVNAAGPYIAATQSGAIALVQASFQAARNNEITQSNQTAFTANTTSRRCAVEREAKNAAGSSFRVAMKCTYTFCP
jgi:hypothetical protein